MYPDDARSLAVSVRHGDRVYNQHSPYLEIDVIAETQTSIAVHRSQGLAVSRSSDNTSEVDRDVGMPVRNDVTPCDDR